MNLSSYLIERVTRLGPPQTRDLTVQRDLQVPMPDGAILLADRWAPKVRGWGLPVLAEIERLEAQSKHLRERARLENIELMRDRWLAFLRQFEGDPLGTLAAQLAGEPEQLTDLIAKRASERERDRDDLRKLFDTTSEAYRDKDVFDFVISTDSALSRLLRHVGIDSVPGTEHRSASPPDESANGASPAHG